MYVVHIYGGIAQLARVLGSYPIGRWFESDCRYQQKTHFCLPTKVRFLNEARLRRMKTLRFMFRLRNTSWQRNLLQLPLHIASGNASLTNEDKCDILIPKEVMS